MQSMRAGSTTNLIRTSTKPKAHTVILSAEDLWRSLLVDKSMKKRYINSGRGLALLALRLSGKLKKSVLGANCLQTTCTMLVARIITTAIGGWPAQATGTILSHPIRSTAPADLPIGFLALDSTPTSPPRGP